MKTIVLTQILFCLHIYVVAQKSANVNPHQGQKIDTLLIGEWLLTKQVNADGGEKSIDPELRGMRRVFFGNGLAEMTSPKMDRMFESLGIENRPTLTWSTLDSKLILESQNPATSQRFHEEPKYKIVSDTLILVDSRGGMAYYLKINKKKKK